MLRRWLLALLGSGALAGPVPAATAPVPDAQALMDWAEKAYPTLFPGHPATGSFPPYTYRLYTATGNIIGVAGTGVYLLGPVVGSPAEPQRIGELADFACQVYAAQCGEQRTLQWTVGGLRREAVVYTPWKARPEGGATGPVPVVFALHGTGGDGPRFLGVSGWREKADEQGFIAVFPSGLHHCYFDDDNENGSFEPAEVKVSTKWAGGRLGLATQRPLCTPDDLARLDATQRALVDHPLADDLGFFRQMIATLVAEHGADARRVYAAGFSNGAEMSTRLAMEASTQFAAVASAAGPGPLPGSLAARPLSLVYTMGQFDAEIAPKLGYPNGLPMNGSIVFNNAVQGAFVDPYTSALRLSGGALYAPVTVAGAPTTQFLWQNSPSGAGNSFSLVVIGELAHAYPNGSNHPLRLADPLWDFFRGQVLPVLPGAPAGAAAPTQRQAADRPTAPRHR